MEEYRIIKALSGFYYVQTEDGVVECRARGRFRRQDQSPLVGDFVRITRQGDKGVLEELLPRKNAFIRPAVANIDQLVVLASCATPVTEPFLIDRVLAIAQMQGVPALVVVNKDDLASAQPLAEIYRKAGVSVLVTSAETGEGIEALREALTRKAFLLDRQFRRRKIQSPQPRLPAASAACRRGFGKAWPRPPHHAPYRTLQFWRRYVRRRYSRLFRIRYRTDGTGAQGTAAICFPRVRSISWPLPVSRLCPPKRTRLRHP